MVFEFKFPDVGEGIHEAELLKWLVKEGDTIKADQAIAEVETDKAVVELPSPKGGTVLKLYAKAGDTIKVGNVIMAVGEKGEKAPDKPSHAAEAAVPASSGKVAEKSIAKTQKVATKVATTGEFKQHKQAMPGQVLATPGVRYLARHLNVDLTTLTGSGPQGRITEEDVKAAAGGIGAGIGGIGQGIEKTAAKQIAIEIHGDVEREKYHSLRKKIGEHMKQSFYTAPFAVHMDEIDVTELVKLREKEKKNAEKKGAKLTYLPFIVKAVVDALKEYPQVNASLDETKDELILKKYYNIGIALDTPEGLMVPVVKNADKKTIIDIAKEIFHLAELGRSRKIALEDLKGGTFTITNIGSIGGTYAVPIINFPEAAILGVLKIDDKPRVVDGKIVARKIMDLVLSFDHRILDGAIAARFMNVIKKHLEDPGLMLIESM